jgi:hypothetical protein
MKSIFLTSSLALLLCSFSMQSQTASVDFNGTNGAIWLGNNYDFGIDSSFSVEAWIKSTDTVGVGQIISKIDSDFRGWGFQRQDADLVVYVIHEYFVQDYIFHYYYSPTLFNGNWHHVAFSYNGNGSIVLYVDGVQVVGTLYGTLTGSFANTASAVIGVSDFSGSPDEYWFGNIDDLRIWRSVRTPQEIANNMICPLTGNEPNLVGYWKLEEGTGTTTTDLANGLIGTLTSGAIWSTDQALNCNIGLNEDFFVADAITVSPNPMATQTRLTFSASVEHASIKVYSLSGQVVFVAENISGSTYLLERRNLPNGTYILRLEEGGKILGRQKLEVIN